MNVFILHNPANSYNKRELFLLTRPFFKDGNWVNDDLLKSSWELNPKEFSLVKNSDEADVALIPKSINYYFQSKRKKELHNLNVLCKQNNIKAYGYISGDFGRAFPEFSNIVYFRMGGFKSQLSEKNVGLQVSLSDHFQRLFHQKTITPSVKPEMATIGFCGHATTSVLKIIKDIVILEKENLKRLFINPIRNDWEPIFAAAYVRAKLLQSIEKSKLVKTNFIYRQHYRAGVTSDEERDKTTLEYYNNIKNSDYVLCVRGTGNFSVRFYETLMMGKIPVLIETDCLLPFENNIDWKKHCIIIPWKNRLNIASYVSDFHATISNNDFKEMQLNCRKIWKEGLSLYAIYSYIKKYN